MTYLSKILSLKELSKVLTRYWPVGILLAICLVIGVLNIKPGISIIGWDNFSVSLDLPNNFKRTLFATWREYRGFGSASDSEVVDIFRQLIFLPLSLFLPSSMLDSSYYVLMLMLGCISSYFLVRLILLQVHKTPETLSIQLASLVAALFYLFNLHTFDVFYFPIAMYLTRYAFFPLMLMAFLRLLMEKKASWKSVLLFITVVLFGSVSYLTATVFFTFLIILGTLYISYWKQLPKLLLLTIFFITLNAFWLLPFSNYFVQKSSLIPTASSFIEVNESLFNKPSSDFTWGKLFMLFPDVLKKGTLPFTTLETREPYAIHPLVTQITTNSWVFYALLTPIILIFCSLFLILRAKFRPHLIWLMLLLGGMVFLLRKELPPFGFIYFWLGKVIPFFTIVFRFGSTKFFPLLLLAGTSLLGAGLYQVFEWLHQQKKKIPIIQVVSISLTIFLLCVLAFPFRGIFTGQLFSPIVENKVPDAYHELAEYLNSDLEYGRVLHLPYDEFSYWRSHTWGYMGSTFLSFMIQRPLLDKTFEPASPELDAFLNRFQSLGLNFTILTPTEQNRRALQAHNLLTATQTKYVVFDESVGQEMAAKKVNGWGVFHQTEYQQLVTVMTQNGLLKKVKDFSLPATDQQKLALYQVIDSRPLFASLTTALNIDPQIENTFIEPLYKEPTSFIQTPSLPYRTFPFWQPKAKLTQTSDQTRIKLPFVYGESLSLKLPATTSATRKTPYKIFANQVDRELTLTFVQELLPLAVDNLESDVQTITLALPSDFDANGASIPVTQLSTTAPIGGNTLLNYRLQVGDSILPFPLGSNEKETYVTTVLLEDQEISVSLLAANGTVPISPDMFELTQDPNCYEDKKEDYSYNLENAGNEVNLNTQNGMTCITAPMFGTQAKPKTTEKRQYYELSFKMNAYSHPTSRLQASPDASNFEQTIKDAVWNLPESGRVTLCILDLETGSCLNEKEDFVSNLRKSVTIPPYKSTESDRAQIIVALQADKNQAAQLRILDAGYRVFKPVVSDSLTLQPQTAPDITLSTKSASDFTLSWNKMLSPGTTFENQNNSPNVYQAPCTEKNGYQKVTTLENEATVSFVENCFQGLSMTAPLPDQSFQLWSVDYNVLKGKQPRFIISTTQTLFNQFLSRYDTYPNIPGFKLLQTPYQIPKSLAANQSDIKNLLETIEYQTAFTVVPPVGLKPEEQNLARYEINQFSEGQSLLNLKSFTIQELPLEWLNLTIDTGKIEQSFDQAEIAETHQILPSLWRLTLKKPTLSVENQMLLTFGQAYDTQWELLATDSVLTVWLSHLPELGTQVKVTGWSNGWIIPTSIFDHQETVTLYVFYRPEKVALIGWLITILTIISASLITLKRRRTEQRYFVSKNELKIRDVLAPVARNDTPTN